MRTTASPEPNRPHAATNASHYMVVQRRGNRAHGLSTQTTEYQREMVERLHVPFEVLSAADFALCDALRLPTFEVEGMRLVKRLTC